MMVLVRYCLKILWNQHSRLLLLLFAVLLIVPLAWSQTNATISRDFDKEMANYRVSRVDTILLATSLSQLPLWMNMKFTEREDTLYVFGISDSGLIDSIARQQAVFRALSLGAMANVTNCEHFSDFYSQEKGSGADSKYEEIYRFSADFSADLSKSAILKNAILSSSEAIVLLGIPLKNRQNNRKKNIRVEAFLYNNEADIIVGNKMSKKVDITIRKRNTDVSQITEQLSLQAKILSKESQRLRDRTKDTSTELIRERSRTRLSWRIKNIDIKDDKMWVNMTTSKF